MYVYIYNIHCVRITCTCISICIDEWTTNHFSYISKYWLLYDTVIDADVRRQNAKGKKTKKKKMHAKNAAKNN